MRRKVNSIKIIESLSQGEVMCNDEQNKYRTVYIYVEWILFTDRSIPAIIRPKKTTFCVRMLVMLM